MTLSFSHRMDCAHVVTRWALKCPLIVLAVSICFFASPAFGYVLMNFNNDTPGTTPAAANAVGIDAYLPAVSGDPLGTVLSSFTWDTGGTAKTVMPYEGAAMYDVSSTSGQARIRAWTTIPEVQTGVVPFSTYLHFAINNNTDDTAINMGISFGGEAEFCLSDSTLGKWVFRLGVGYMGGAMFEQQGSTYVDMGGTPFTETDWYQLYGTVDTVNKKWTLYKKNLTTGQTDSWVDRTMYDTSVDDVGMVYFRGSTNTSIHTLYDKVLLGTEPTVLAGDVNGDGVVNLADLGILIDHYGQSGMAWASGDLNNDGAVNLADLGILIDHYGTSGSGLDIAGQNLLAAHGLGSPVPEPSTFALLLAGALGLLLCFTRRKGRGFMKRSFGFLAAVLVLGTAVAQAETINVSVTRTVYDASLDKLVIKLASFDAGIPASSHITSMEGTWTVLSAGGAAGICLHDSSVDGDTGDPISWESYTTSGGKVNGYSYINLPTTTDKLGNGSDAYRTSAGLTDMYTAFANTWANTSGYLAVNSTIAVMYVTHDAGVSFSGGATGGVYLAGTGVITPASFTVTATPEPGTVVLLASGLVGLLIAAWRRKR